MIERTMQAFADEVGGERMATAILFASLATELTGKHTEVEQSLAILKGNGLYGEYWRHVGQTVLEHLDQEIAEVEALADSLRADRDALQRNINNLVEELR